MGLIKPGVVSGKNQHPAPHAHTCLPGSARRSRSGSLMIQMETSSLGARSCLRTPLQGPSPGINHGQRPRPGRAAVAPRSEASGRAGRPGAAPWWSPARSCRELGPLPRSRSLGASSSARGAARASETYPVRQTDQSPALGFMMLGWFLSRSTVWETLTRSPAPREHPAFPEPAGRR